MHAMTSRRCILGGIAAAIAAPATVACASSIGANPDQLVLNLVDKVMATNAALDAAIDNKSPAERAMFAWRRRNPKPIMREFQVKTVKWNSTDPIGAGTPDYHAYFRAVDEANADMVAAMADHNKALNAWKQRHDIAHVQSGLEDAEAREDEVSDIGNEAVNNLCNTRAVTLAGLIAKSRAAEIDPAIGRSILIDLKAMGVQS